MRLDERGRALYPQVCTSLDLARALQESCDWFCGVPDSMFRRLIPVLDPYVAAPRENHGLAMAFGARLGGRRPCLLIQNSGLGLLGDALFGMQHLYEKGVLLVVTLRGELAWEEPQHHHWGRASLAFLDVLDLPVFDLQELGTGAVEKAAELAFGEERPAAVVLHRGNIDE